MSITCICRLDENYDSYCDCNCKNNGTCDRETVFVHVHMIDIVEMTEILMNVQIINVVKMMQYQEVLVITMDHAHVMIHLKEKHVNLIDVKLIKKLMVMINVKWLNV